GVTPRDRPPAPRGPCWLFFVCRNLRAPMNSTRQQRRRPAWRPQVEGLEDRLVPALGNVVVNSTADDTNAHAYTTLRDAINLVDGGVGASSITFDAVVFATP